MPGFSFNQNTQRSEYKIIFSEVTVSPLGPQTSLHLFYSLDQAKLLLAQLQAAIAQAEGTAPLNPIEVAGDLYRDFCEAEGGFEGPLFEACIDFEAKHGDIEVGDEAEKLILAAMAHALEYGGID